MIAARFLLLLWRGSRRLLGAPGRVCVVVFGWS
jgi:hypothetical protein